MKRSAGFTLIELVIVIIILGILAVTAAPKFINLQGDARESTLKGMKAAMESSASLVYSKSVILGLEAASSGTDTVSAGNSTVTVKYGYPTATANGIGNALDLSTNDWASAAGSTFVVWPQGLADGVSASCNVTYEASTAEGDRPNITVNSGGC